ncbi:MAG: hypothetical protein ACR5LA_11850 [Wolbachia sp.]
MANPQLGLLAYWIFSDSKQLLSAALLAQYPEACGVACTATREDIATKVVEWL